MQFSYDLDSVVVVCLVQWRIFHLHFCYPSNVQNTEFSPKLNVNTKIKIFFLILPN